MVPEKKSASAAPKIHAPSCKGAETDGIVAVWAAPSGVPFRKARSEVPS